MSANVSGVKHTRGFDVIKPLSVSVLIAIMDRISDFQFVISNSIQIGGQRTS